jgi:4-hydroxy-tetrahydrodipicolinate synthase
MAIKESTGNLAQISEIARTLPEGKTLLSGDDNMALPSIAVGASGLVSVLGNLVPAETKALVEAALRGDLAEAQRLHYKLLPLMDALFMESSPGPLKAGLKLMGLAGDALRLPLVPAEPATVARMAETLRMAGVTNLVGATR